MASSEIMVHCSNNFLKIVYFGISSGTSDNPVSNNHTILLYKNMKEKLPLTKESSHLINNGMIFWRFSRTIGELTIAKAQLKNKIHI